MSGYVSEKVRSYLQARIFQNRLRAFKCFDMEYIKSIFGRKHKALSFATIYASITIKFNFFQHNFGEVYTKAIINKKQF